MAGSGKIALVTGGNGAGIGEGGSPKALRRRATSRLCDIESIPLRPTQRYRAYRFWM